MVYCKPYNAVQKNVKAMAQVTKVAVYVSGILQQITCIQHSEEGYKVNEPKTNKKRR